MNKLNDLFYAKSSGETLTQHINNVLNQFEKLLDYINLDSIEVEIIRYLIYYHDLGKANPIFQNKIIKIGKLPAKTHSNPPAGGEVWHEYLSPAFVFSEKEKIKNLLNQLNISANNIDLFDFFLFCIISHHHRNNFSYFSGLDAIISKYIGWINKHFSGLQLHHSYRIRDLMNKFEENITLHDWKILFPYRVRWLGALMKCDYAASAQSSINYRNKPETKNSQIDNNNFQFDVETSFEGNYQKFFDSFLTKKQIKLRPFQIKCKKLYDNNVILQASTGMGKTEAAMNWINGQKSFYLLGIRTAVNAMYERFKRIFGVNVTILHGESSFALLSDVNDEDDFDLKLEKTRKLSFPLTVATADQLISSVFKYPGFEFVYLTCTYSKIIIDEIQSFSPASIAAIVVFLKNISNLGGKYMLSTATLPQFLLDELKDTNYVQLEPVLLNLNRHKITIINEPISDSNKLLDIISQNKYKKILILCNTVKRAQSLYEDLINHIDIKLLHSQFIRNDRYQKEQEITSAKPPCVWLSTQIVEASLDIDFDILITEIAPIESLLQRMGRCYRLRQINTDQPNVYIFASNPQDNVKYVYDEFILKKTWEHIQNYDQMILSEVDKMNLINLIFDGEIRKTQYWQKYQETKNLLEMGYRTSSKDKAYENFRDITNNLTVIPEPVYISKKTEINNIIEKIENKNTDKIEKLKLKDQLMSNTITMQYSYRKLYDLLNIQNSKYCSIKNIKIIKNCQYDSSVGLKKQQLNSIDFII